MSARETLARRIRARIARKARRVLGLPPPRVASDWTDPFATLRARWGRIPAGPRTRADSTDLDQLSDEELRAFWERSRTDVTTGEQWGHRGWYHELYRDAFRGKQLLDIGCGLAIDTLTFAQQGANVTFLDLHRANLDLVERIARILGVPARTVLLEDLGSLERLGTYSHMLALGSLHHAPVDLIASEAKALLAHLPVGGRWIQLAYPMTRWIRDGRPPFDAWGQMTDGLGTPWAEPYDLTKLLGVLGPATFDPVLVREFHGGDFIWFDLLRIG